jgi:hypothetical protein
VVTAAPPDCSAGSPATGRHGHHDGAGTQLTHNHRHSDTPLLANAPPTRPRLQEFLSKVL